MRDRLEEQFGILRSFAIYYAPGRVRRLSRFYAGFIRPGDLCFDIGAHLGNRTAAWTRLGARVVAVEPQPQLMNWLRRLHGHSSAVTLLQSAVGAAPGEAVLHHDPRNPTVSTLSNNWIAAVSRDASFGGVRWRPSATVDVTTLDALIADHGLPALCKLDVEGFEAEALRGLSVALPIIAFEYVPAAIEVAFECIERLASLGEYEFNWFPGESHRWVTAEWVTASAMPVHLDRLAAGHTSGDIFARLGSVA